MRGNARAVGTLAVLAVAVAFAGGLDDDNDGVPDDEDCRPNDSTLWAAPAAPVTDLLLDRDGTVSLLNWSRPTDLGGVPGSERYDTFASANPTRFGYPGAYCGEINDPSLFSTDVRVPLPGATAFYLTRVENACGNGPVDSIPPPVQPRTTDYLEVIESTDSGPGSLRDVLAGTTGGEAICFDVSGTIPLTSGSLIVDKEVVVAGPGADVLTVDGGGAERVFELRNNIELCGLTVTGGSIGLLQEGYVADAEVVITTTTIRGNNSGVWAYGYGDRITIRDSIIENNTGSGFFSIGYYTEAEITETLIRGNARGVSFHYTSYYSTVDVRNSTIAGNDLGFRLDTSYSNYLTVTHSTVADNDVGSYVSNFEAVPPVARFSIFDNVVDCDPAGDEEWAGGFNVYGSATTCVTGSTDIVADPLLGPLGDHGGPTETFPLLLGSPAIDAATCSPSTLVQTDQRGFPRPRREEIGTGQTSCDIGAYERQPR